MALFGGKPQPEPTTSPHPIGLPDDVHEALATANALTRAERLRELELAGASIGRLICCRPEATLFLNGIGRAMTGWRWQFLSGRIEVRYESGFRESPSEWATPLDEGVRLVTASP